METGKDLGVVKVCDSPLRSIQTYRKTHEMHTISQRQSMDNQQHNLRFERNTVPLPLPDRFSLFSPKDQSTKHIFLYLM